MRLVYPGLTHRCPDIEFISSVYGGSPPYWPAKSTSELSVDTAEYDDHFNRAEIVARQ